MKLPTHRELADHLGVAVGTVTRAYAEAEQRGLIYGDGRRGTFVGEGRRGQSDLAALTAPNPLTIDLSVNYPVYEEDPDLRSALRRLSRRPEIQEFLHYPPAEGLTRHREAGSAWLSSLGFEIAPDRVLVTAGAQHALTVIFAALVKPGETVLTDPLTYPGIKAVADLQGWRLVGVPTDRDGMLPDAIEHLCKQRKPRAIYCVPTLQNPTNVIMPTERRRAVAEVAARYDLLIVEDEIHRRLVANPPPLFAALVPERTLLVGAPSKVVAGGLRVGFAVAPERFHRSLVGALQTTMLAAPPLTAEVFALWLESGTVERTIARRRREAALRQELAAQTLRGFPVRAFETSYFVWLDLPAPWSRMEVASRAQRRGVAVAPADTFAVPGSPVPEAIRISLGTVDNHERLKQGLSILADILSGSPGGDSAVL